MAVLGSNTLDHTDNLLIQRNSFTKVNVTNTGVVVTGIVTATTFNGALDGNADTASNATQVTLTAGSLTTNYVTFAEGTTGNRPIKTDAGLTYNASTNILGASISGTATNCSRSILAGDGVTGGGALTADRTINLGTPGSVTSTSTNSVSGTSHTHNLDATLTTGAIGSYRLFRCNSTLADGSNRAGSSLNISYANDGGNWVTRPTTASGTWRNMSGFSLASNEHGIFQRVA